MMNNINNEVGIRIKKIRKLLNLTLEQFGKSISTSPNYIWMLEKNDKPINDRYIKLISITYNVNEKWLKTGEGEMFISSLMPDEWIEKIIKKYKKLNPIFQKYIDGEIDRLLTLQNKGHKHYQEISVNKIDYDEEKMVASKDEQVENEDFDNIP